MGAKRIVGLDAVTLKLIAVHPTVNSAFEKNGVKLAYVDSSGHAAAERDKFHCIATVVAVQRQTQLHANRNCTSIVEVTFHNSQQWCQKQPCMVTTNYTSQCSMWAEGQH